MYKMNTNNSNNTNKNSSFNYNDYDYDDNNDNDDDNNYEHIRAPDPVVREKLIENNYYNYYNYNHNHNHTYNYNHISNKYDTDEETNDMILESILKQTKEEYDKEQEQKDLLRLERFKLKEFYIGIKNKINRIKGYDTTNQEIYDKILNIIEKYENAEINYFYVEQTILDKIFTIMASLRMTPSEMEFLRKLIVV
jgi:hypothetical protein